jgi:hypothetical protein
MKTCQNNSCRASFGDQAAFCPKCGTAATSVAPLVAPPPIVAGRPLAPPPPPMRVAPPPMRVSPPIQPDLVQPAAPSAATPVQATLTATESPETNVLTADKEKKSNNKLWMIVCIFLVCVILGYFVSQSSGVAPLVTSFPADTTPSDASPRKTWPQIVKTINELCQDAQYAPYFSKAPCDALKATTGELADSSIITRDQKNAMGQWSTASESIQRDMLIFYQKGDNRYQQLGRYFEAVYLPAVRKARTDVYNGNMTWGQYNQQRQWVIKAFMAEASRLKL